MIKYSSCRLIVVCPQMINIFSVQLESDLSLLINLLLKEPENLNIG